MKTIILVIVVAVIVIGFYMFKSNKPKSNPANGGGYPIPNKPGKNDNSNESN